jgi:hypothetical protein
MIRSCMRTYEVPNIDVKRKYTTMAKIAIGRRILQSTMFLVTLIVLIIISSAVAQSGAMYIYPAKGQDKNKQDEDRYDCHSWAVSQTGYDPSRPQTITPGSGAQQYRPSQPHILRGGARGAALGAVGGAIAGDAGKGAASGAAMGGLAGGFRRRDERRQQVSQQQANDQAAQQNQQSAYQRAMAACLEGRGYTVK